MKKLYPIDNKDIKPDYWKIAEAERHFNLVEAGIRGLASTWMLAAFAVIAQLINSRSDAIMIVVVCTMVTIGLTVLWILDQLVYHRILDSFFLVGLKMEYENDKLPPIRLLLVESALESPGEKGFDYWMRLYYVIPISGFIVISVATTVYQGLNDVEFSKIEFMNIYLVGLLLILIQIILLIWILIRSRDVDIMKRIESLNIKKLEIKNIIEKYRQH